MEQIDQQPNFHILFVSTGGDSKDIEQAAAAIDAACKKVKVCAQYVKAYNSADVASHFHSSNAVLLHFRLAVIIFHSSSSETQAAAEARTESVRVIRVVNEWRAMRIGGGGVSMVGLADRRMMYTVDAAFRRPEPPHIDDLLHSPLSEVAAYVLVKNWVVSPPVMWHARPFHTFHHPPPLMLQQLPLQAYIPGMALQVHAVGPLGSQRGSLASPPNLGGRELGISFGLLDSTLDDDDIDIESLVAAAAAAAAVPTPLGGSVAHTPFATSPFFHEALAQLQTPSQPTLPRSPPPSSSEQQQAPPTREQRKRPFSAVLDPGIHLTEGNEIDTEHHDNIMRKLQEQQHFFQQYSHDRPHQPSPPPLQPHPCHPPAPLRVPDTLQHTHTRTPSLLSLPPSFQPACYVAPTHTHLRPPPPGGVFGAENIRALLEDVEKLDKTPMRLWRSAHGSEEACSRKKKGLCRMLIEVPFGFGSMNAESHAWDIPVLDVDEEFTSEFDVERQDAHHYTLKAFMGEGTDTQRLQRLIASGWEGVTEVVEYVNLYTVGNHAPVACRITGRFLHGDAVVGRVLLIICPAQLHDYVKKAKYGYFSCLHPLSALQSDRESTLGDVDMEGD